MSTDRDPTRIVLSWLHTDENVSADRLLDDVLATVDTTPQRRSNSWFARRFPIMNNNFVRYGLAAAAVVVVAIVGISLFGPNLGGTPDPTPSPTPQATTPTTYSLPRELGSMLTFGTYALVNFPVTTTLEIPGIPGPAEWRACSESDDEQAVCYWPTPADTAGQLAFLIVTNVADNPCVPGATLLDPAVGPSVDDLVAAISNLEGFVASAPEDISVDGFAGKKFTLTAPADTTCEGFGPWATAFRTTGMGPGEINVLRIIDVDGVRVMINIANDPASLEAAAFEAVLASVQFYP